MTLSVLLILIVAVGIALVAVILIQQTQAGGLSAFTGGASGSVFGAKGSTGFLFKMTAGLMITFAVLCVAIAGVAGSAKSESLVDSLVNETVESAPDVKVENEAVVPSLEEKVESKEVTPPALEVEKTEIDKSE